MNAKKAKLLRKELRLKGITGQTSYNLVTKNSVKRGKINYIVLGKCFRRDYQFWKRAFNSVKGISRKEMSSMLQSITSNVQKEVRS